MPKTTKCTTEFSSRHDLNNYSSASTLCSISPVITSDPTACILIIMGGWKTSLITNILKETAKES